MNTGDRVIWVKPLLENDDRKGMGGVVTAVDGAVVMVTLDNGHQILAFEHELVLDC